MKSEVKKNLRGDDMPLDEFLSAGHEAINWAAELRNSIDTYPVLPDVSPGDIKAKLPTKPPVKGEPMSDILADLDRVVLPGMTHWNHPSFFAYFCSNGSAPGILGELVSATLNNNGMAWKSCPVSTELEEVTLEWLRQMVGLPESFWGMIYDTASVSTLHAIAAAREACDDLEIRRHGMSGRTDLPLLRLYASEHAHSSIEKAVIMLGMGIEGVRKIPCDSELGMDAGALAEAISEDRANGVRPFCVVATVGTTSTTAIDPVAKLVDICRKEDLWLHVDAAYAGSAAVLPEKRPHFQGWEDADSIVINPHKWLFVPIDLSVLYTRRPEILKRAFSLDVEYLKTPEDSQVENRMDYGIQLGRRFRSLKLWFVLRYFGVEGIQARLRKHIAQAKTFASWVDEVDELERMAPVNFGVICFCWHPPGIQDDEKLNLLNESLLNEINRGREIYLSHTKVGGRYIIRFAVGHLLTEERHLRRAFDIIRTAFERLRKSETLT